MLSMARVLSRNIRPLLLIAAVIVALELPLPDGSSGTFRVVQSPIMEPGLAARYPQITTYIAQGVDDPTATARLDRTPLGFHAMVLSASGTWFVDPYSRSDTTYYISYRKQDYALP